MILCGNAKALSTGKTNLGSPKLYYHQKTGSVVGHYQQTGNFPPRDYAFRCSHFFFRPLCQPTAASGTESVEAK